MLLKRVRKWVKEHDLLPPQSKVLVGVSGGPDSMALLHVLRQLAVEFDWELIAVHVNHRLRGEASDEDEHYVRTQCQAWGIPCDVESVDVAAHLQKHGGNKQAVARMLRYEAFRRVALKRQVEILALAHHGDDQVETILMRLVRGGAPGSLTGISSLREWEGIRIVRPMLNVFREDVESYCDIHKLLPRLDESNLDRQYTRNRLRMEIVPRLCQINPRFREGILQYTTMAEAEESMWKKLVEQASDQVSLSRDQRGFTLDSIAFVQLDVALQRRLIKLILNCLMESGTNEGTFHAVEQIRYLAKQPDPSMRIDLPGGLEAEREYQLLRIVYSSSDPAASITVPLQSLNLSGKTEFSPYPGHFCARIESQPISHKSLHKNCALFDADLLEYPLTLRSRCSGDRVRPVGLQGTKKVKDILIDAKVPRRLRNVLPLVVSGKEIIWIPGVLRSETALTTKDTRSFLYLEWVPHSQ